MRLGRYLSSKTKPELDSIKDVLNLTESEEVVFNQLAKGKSNVAVATYCSMSTSAVDARIRDIRAKLRRIGGDYID